MVSRCGAVEAFLVSVCCCRGEQAMTMDKETQAIEMRVAFIRLTVFLRTCSISFKPILDRAAHTVNPVNGGHRCADEVADGGRFFDHRNFRILFSLFAPSYAAETKSPN